MPPGQDPASEEMEGSAVRRGTTLFLGLLCTFGPISLDLYLPALPSLATDLQTTPAAAQLSITACLFGLAIGQLLVGPLSDRIGRRVPLVTGVVVYLLATIACALAPNVEVLVGLRLVQGLGGAAGLVVARAVARDLYSGQQLLQVFSRLAVIGGVAPVVAPVLGGQLARIVDWRGIFWVLAAFGVVLVGAALLLVESHPVARRTSGGLAATFAGYRVLLADRVFLGVIVAISFAAASMFAYIAGATFVLQDLYGLSAVDFSLVFGTNSIGIVTLSALTGTLGRFGLSTVAVMGLGVAGNLLGSLGLLASVLVGLPLPALLVSLFVMVASLGLLFPSGTTMAMADHPDHAGAASSLLGLGQFVMGGVVAPLVGIAGKDTDVPLGVVAAACSAIAALVYVLVVRRPR